jgi:uncharacterized protein
VVSSDSSLLTFPTDYPIKVLGRSSDEFRSRVHAIMLEHAPALGPERMSERLSENGNFLSLSYLVPAESREQIEHLAAALAACRDVLLVI